MTGIDQRRRSLEQSPIYRTLGYGCEELPGVAGHGGAPQCAGSLGAKVSLSRLP